MSESETYVETCGELLYRAGLDDAMTNLRNALGTEYTHPGAWAAVVSAAGEVAYEAENMAATASQREGNRE